MYFCKQLLSCEVRAQTFPLRNFFHTIIMQKRMTVNKQGLQQSKLETLWTGRLSPVHNSLQLVLGEWHSILKTSPALLNATWGPEHIFSALSGTLVAVFSEETSMWLYVGMTLKLHLVQNAPDKGMLFGPCNNIIIPVAPIASALLSPIKNVNFIN